MSGAKLNNLKEAVKLVLDQMQPQDYVALTIFDDKAQVVSTSQPLTDRGHLKSLVDGIRDGGGTEMSRGMKLGINEAKKALDAQRVSRILLLTDGQTYGDESQCQQLGVEAGGMGIPIIALGLGDDWNAELLDAIARGSGSNGVSDQIDVPEKIQHFFQSALQGMQATVVSNAQLILRLVTGVTIRQVWRVVPLISQITPTAQSDRDIQVQLGDLEREQGQSLLIELLLPPRPVGRYRIAQAEINYDVPGAHIVGERARGDVVIDITDNPALLQQYEARVMSLVEKVTAFKLQTRALEEAKAGNIPGATQKLRAAATRLLDMGEGDLAAAAEEEAKRLEQGQEMSAAGTKKLQYGTRKLTQRLDQP
jgi:Ca-activated chloride channel family protein